MSVVVVALSVMFFLFLILDFILGIYRFSVLFLLALWLCICIHFVIEGYFSLVYFNQNIIDDKNN